MPNRSSNRGRGHKDLNEVAFSIVQQATGQAPKVMPKESPAAAALERAKEGKSGKGTLTPAKRKEIAKKAARARWNK